MTDVEGLARAMFASREEAMRREYPDSSIEPWDALTPQSRSIWLITAEVFADDYLPDLIAPADEPVKPFDLDAFIEGPWEPPTHPGSDPARRGPGPMA